jgi:hypothetical protein
MGDKFNEKVLRPVWMTLKRIGGLSISIHFGGGDGRADKCLRCAVPRQFHGRDHAFVEKEK